MAVRIQSPLRGLAILSDDMRLESLTDQGVGLTDSSFQQQGPRPGQAVIDDPDAKLEPQISGGQRTEVEIQVRRAGLPELEGVGVVWRRTDEQPDDIAWRGRATMNFVNHWIAAVWSETDSQVIFDLVVTTAEQQLILLYAETTSDPLKSKTFSFPIVSEATNSQAAPTGTGFWGSAKNVSANPNNPSALPDVALWDAVTGVALPNGRVLAFGFNGDISVYSSDDAGTTWEPYASPASDSFISNTIDRARAVFYRGNIVAFSGDGAAIAQQSSNALGTKFSTVIDHIAGAGIGTEICAVALPNNTGIVLGYIRDSDDLPVVRVLNSASQPFLNSPEILVDPAFTVDHMELTVDGSGRLFVYGQQTGITTIQAWFSLDNAATWTFIPQSVFRNQSLSRPTNFAAIHCRGWSILAHNWFANVGDEDDSIGTLWTAGWGSLSNGAGGFDNPITDRFAWDTDGIPIETPGDTVGWANLGTTAPTLESPGELEFDTVAANGFSEADPVGSAGSNHVFYFEGKITAGTVADASFLVGGFLRIADGTNDFRIEVRFNNSIAGGRIRLIDTHSGATLGDIAPWDTEEWTQFAVSVDSLGLFVTAYRRPWHTRWMQGPSIESGSGLTDGGPLAATNQLRFGNVAAATVTTRWRQWHHASAQFSDLGLTLGVNATNDRSGKFIDIGGLINNLPSPVPEIGEEDRPAFLSAQRGPGKRGRIYTITPLFDFGIEQLFPTVSPSPDSPWRSVDTTEQKMIFDLGEDSRLGAIWHLIFGFFNCNVNIIEIEGKTAAAGAFSSIGTYNGAEGFEGLTYELTGDTIRPAAGTIDAARFLNRNELRGGSGPESSGFVILNTGGAPTTVHRIRSHSAGGWTDPTVNSTLLPEIRLDGITGIEAASGLCDIVFPSGVLSLRQAGLVPTTYIRFLQIRIPASSISPDLFRQIGNKFAGTASIYGKSVSDGWSQEMRPNTSRRVSRYGTVRKRRDGPPARRWTMGWADGVVERRITEPIVNVPYLAVDGTSAALAVSQDVWGLLWGLLEETQGGEVPVIGLEELPAADGMLLDRRQFLFATWDSSVQFNQVTSDVGDGVFGRVDPITIAELK